MGLTMSNEEKTLARLEAQYCEIMRMIADLKESIPRTVQAEITQHTLDCINRKKDHPSYPPGFFANMDPRVKSKLVNTVIAVLSTAGTVLAMKFGIGI